MWLVGLLLLTLPAAGCRRSVPTAKADAGAQAARVSAPAATLIEIILPRPAETWRRVRALLGPTAAVLPVTFPVLLAGLLDLPTTAAGVFDEQIAPRAVLLVESTGPELVLSVHVRSGAELVAMLTTGQQPSHIARPLGAGQTLLEPKTPAPEPRVLLVQHNALIVGQSRSATVAAAPYLVQALGDAAPTSPAADFELVSSAAALSGPAKTLLTQSWQARRRELELAAENARGRARRSADFGEPAAVMAAADRVVETLSSLLSSAARARVAVELGAEQVVVEGELEASPGGELARWLPEVKPGALDALLELPAEVSFAVASSSTEPGRAQSAARWAATAREIFGERLLQPDADELARTLRGLATSRGDELAFGVALDPIPRAVATFSVRDYAAFNGDFKRLLGLLEKPAFARPLQSWLGAPRVSFGALPGFPGEHARLALAGGKERPPSELHALWTERRGRVTMALGAVPKSLTDELARTGVELNRSTDATRLRRVGAGSGLMLLLDLDRYAGGASSPPIVFGVGSRTPQGAAPRAWAKLELPPELVAGWLGRLGSR